MEPIKDTVGMFDKTIEIRQGYTIYSNNNNGQKNNLIYLKINKKVV